MNLFGRGTVRDAVKAEALFRQSAAQGNGNACYNLGWMYEKGDGVPQNSQLAQRWYREGVSRNSISSSEARAHAEAFLAGNR
jgi:hypothetical protein